MSDVVIRVEGLGKKYRLRTNTNSYRRYKTLQESLLQALRAPFRAVVGDGVVGDPRPEFWALKDVEFDVTHGEVLGIIGHNGAGKSTLLKILSQITEPTEGYIGITGRIACLLDVGTGFHPELSGRENIILNGAILGMSRADVARRFDEIVTFAGVEKFIDTPVKHYSSGMYLRLAFSVAAHLEPDILVVDEVLAVGDAEFQQKCLGKMGDVAREGRTILFVSHNMGAISALCTNAIVLDHGMVTHRGTAATALAYYGEQISRQLGLTSDLRTWENRNGTGEARIVWARVSWESRYGVTECVALGDDLLVTFDVELQANLQPSHLLFACTITTITGIPVLHVTNADYGYSLVLRKETRITLRLPNLSLFPGTYVVSLWIGTKRGETYDLVKDCLRLEIIKGQTIQRDLEMTWHDGLVCHPSEWTSSP